jgi:hypothetical protein
MANTPAVSRDTTPRARALPPGIKRRESEATGETAYQVRVRKSGHPTFTKTFSRLEEAKAWKASVESRINRNESVLSATDSRITVEKVIEDYLESGEVPDGDKKRYTLQQVSEEFGALAVKNLTAPVVKAWVEKLKKTHVPPPKNRVKDHPLYDRRERKTYSESSIRKLYYALKTAVEWHSGQHS